MDLSYACLEVRAEGVALRDEGDACGGEAFGTGAGAGRDVAAAVDAEVDAAGYGEVIEGAELDADAVRVDGEAVAVKRVAVVADGKRAVGGELCVGSGGVEAG